MVNVVKSWELDEEISANIIKTIQENAIDDDNISRLTPELIKELFPKIGLRLHFLDKWMATYGQHNKSHLNQESEMESVECDVNTTVSNEGDDNEFALKRQDAFLGKTMFFLRTQNINIKLMLNKTMQGQAILQSYKKTKTLSRKCRNVIVDLILSEILLKTNRLTNQDFDCLAKQSSKFFLRSRYILTIFHLLQRDTRVLRSLLCQEENWSINIETKSVN